MKTWGLLLNFPFNSLRSSLWFCAIALQPNVPTTIAICLKNFSQRGLKRFSHSEKKLFLEVRLFRRFCHSNTLTLDLNRFSHKNSTPCPTQLSMCWFMLELASLLIFLSLMLISYTFVHTIGPVFSIFLDFNVKRTDNKNANRRELPLL